MSEKITPWKNTGKKGEKEMRLFRISWSESVSSWVKDPNGTTWGFEDIITGKIIPGMGKKTKEVTLTMPNLIVGTPSLGVSDKSEEEEE